MLASSGSAAKGLPLAAAYCRCRDKEGVIGWPRYVRIVDGLPRTPTAKIEKVKLREAGITSDTWDRDKAGITIKREKVGVKSA